MPTAKPPSKPHSRRRVLSASVLLAVSASFAGCAVGPTYREPQAQAAASWQAPVPHGGSSADLQRWWQQFDDPLVAQLIAQAEAGSPTLAKASAAIDKARATLTSAGAASLPSVSGNGSLTHAGQQQSSQSTTSTSRSAALDASWEIDLFGKARRNSEAAQARVDARISDWHDARVSLAAEVADTYVQYRGCRLLADAYQRELQSVSKTGEATAAAVKAGFNAPSDATLARASVASTRSTAVQQQTQCELLVKSLVALTGSDEPTLRQKLDQGQAKLPQPQSLEVKAVPAEVLRQRPDLASLERELAATSAEIGAAQADLYPSLSLSGLVSIAATAGASSITSWSFGPSLSIPLFDGGKRRAAVSSAQASYDAALASWRAGVRTVVKEVEQALVNLDSAARRSEDAATAAEQYRSYEKSVEANWRAGNVSLLSLEEARRSALSAEISQISLQQSRVQNWIALYKALGGGWQAGAAAVPPSKTQNIAQGAAS